MTRSKRVSFALCILLLALTAGLVLFVLGFRNRSTLTRAALLRSAFFGYAAFALLIFHQGLRPDSITVLCAVPLSFLVWNLLAVTLVTSVFAFILPCRLNPRIRTYIFIHHVGGILAFLASARIFYLLATPNLATPSAAYLSPL